jgi:hypothetical protein
MQRLSWQRGAALPHDPHDATTRALPQLSGNETEPQFLSSRAQKAVSVSGVQPQTFGVPPPPQARPVPKHPPHDATVRGAPQLSVPDTEPQFLPCRVQKAASVSGVQPQTLDVPRPPHVWGAVHAPQSAVRALPQLSAPVTEPQFLL